MNNKFYELAKGLAQSTTRRQVLKRFGSGLTGMALACFGLANQTQARTTSACTTKSARLNGKPFTRTWLTHDTITVGGLLEFQMGPKPNENWGSGEGDVPPDYFN